jgi:hypothetical protein
MAGAQAQEKCGRLPRVLVIGALGRCGTGACDLAVQVGLPEDHIVRWDMAETAAGGPFPQLLDVDILVNCIYLSQKIPPFITIDMLHAARVLQTGNSFFCLRLSHAFSSDMKVQIVQHMHAGAHDVR